MNSTSSAYRQTDARRAEITNLERSKAIRTKTDYDSFLNSLSRSEWQIWSEVLPVPER